MHNLARLAPAAVLALGAVLVLSVRGEHAVPLPAPLAQSLPPIAGYQVQTQRISDDERAVSAMTDYVARVYSRDSVVAFTTLVSYYDRQSRGQSIHSPRNCLPGAGWEIVSGGLTRVAISPGVQTVNEYVVKNGANRALVYYWYQGRGRVVADEFGVKWNLLRDAVVRGHTEEALVRIVIPVRTSSTDTDAIGRARALGSSVAASLIVDVARVLPHEG
jgi:EpsI family protein